MQFVWKAGYNASQTMACCNHACQLANYRNSKSFYLCKSSCYVKKADVYPFDWQFIKAEATAVTGINALTSIIAKMIEIIGYCSTNGILELLQLVGTEISKKPLHIYRRCWIFKLCISQAVYMSDNIWIKFKRIQLN